LLALGVLLGACSAAQIPVPADKAGTQTRRLEIGEQDATLAQDQPPGVRTFLDSLASVSGGQIQYDLIPSAGGNGADGETKLVQAIADGQVQAGFPATRAFANAGIPGLEAVEAPMTITSYAAEKDLVSGSVASDLLAQLKGTGMVGLGLAVGPLRRPFAAIAPLLGPDDWRGVPFRSFNSPIQDATIRALGGNPVEAADWLDEIVSGQLRGVDWDIPQDAINSITDSSFATDLPYITANVVLWPKLFVFAVSQKLWDSLTDEQRAWIQEAADAGTKASVDAIYDESTAAVQLCDLGVRFVDASAAQLAALKTAVAPVISTLASDPVSGPLLARIQAIAAQHPDTDVPDVPSNCQTLTASPGPSIPLEVSSLPAGTYRVQITAADLDQAGLKIGTGDTGIWSLTINADGTYVMGCQADADPGVDCGNIPANTRTPVQAGYVRGSDRTVWFVPDVQVAARLLGCLMPISAAQYHCLPSPAYWLDWASNGTTLTFTNTGGLARDLDSLSLKPWSKVG
jgi:TRAP-type C4-dicarboxylate transport system substrate-binding protein